MLGKESFISSWSTWKDGGELLLFALKMGRFRSAEKDKTWARSEEGQGCRGRDPSENMHPPFTRLSGEDQADQGCHLSSLD